MSSSPNPLDPPSPPRSRKRSSFIARRESMIIPNPLTEQEQRDKENLEYLQKLTAEKDAWKNWYRDKKGEYEKLQWKRKHESQPPIPLSKCYELLSDEMKTLISQRPPLEEIAAAATEYTKQCNDILAMHHELELRKMRVMEYVSEEVQQLENKAFEGTFQI